MAEFTLKISACAPIKDNDEKGKIIINFDAGSSYGPAVINEEKCKCDCPDKLKSPPAPYNLKKCPIKTDQQDVFAWDCETNFEAKNEGEAVAHDATVKNRNGLNATSDKYPANPPWLKKCKKCKCKIYLKVKILGHEGESGEGEVYAWDVKQKSKDGYIVKEIGTFSSSGSDLDSTKEFPNTSGLTAYTNEAGETEDFIYISTTRSTFDTRDDDDVSIAIEAKDFFTDKILLYFSNGDNTITCL
jgi:hypothetical protein